MNRLSPKHALSKFRTAVRVTVGLLNMTVAIALTFFFLTSAAVATPDEDLKKAAERIKQLESQNSEYGQMKAAYEAACKEKATSEDCTIAKGQFLAKYPIGNEQASRGCEMAQERVNKMAEQATKACSLAGFGQDWSRCYSSVKQCTETSADVDDIDPEDVGGQGEYCNKAFANVCPGLDRFNTGLDYRQEKRDAERDRVDAKTALDEIINQQREASKAAISAKRDIQDKQAKDAFSQREAERKVEQDIKDGLKGVSDQQKKAFQDAQNTYTQMDAAYIGMRDQKRKSVSAVAAAKDKMIVACRGEAEKNYQADEKVRKQNAKTGKRNVGTNVSGSNSRWTAAMAKKRTIDYANYYNQCMLGKSGPSSTGAAAQSEVDAAQRSADDDDKLIADKAAAIEKQRQSVLDQLKQLESDSTNSQTEVIDAANRQLTTMSEAKKLQDDQNQRAIQEFAQNQAQDTQVLNGKLDEANKQLIKTEKEASLATKRMDCAGKVATQSESKRDKTSQGFQEGVDAISNVNMACFNEKNICKKAGVDISADLKAYSAETGAPSGGMFCDRVSAVFKGKDPKTKKVQDRIKDAGDADTVK